MTILLPSRPLASPLRLRVLSQPDAEPDVMNDFYLRSPDSSSSPREQLTYTKASWRQHRPDLWACHGSEVCGASAAVAGA